MLQCLPGYGDRIFYHPVVSAPDTDDEARWTGRVGFLSDVAREMFADCLAQFEIYFAGPPAMAEATLRMLVDMKVPPDQIHYDQFY